MGLQLEAPERALDSRACEHVLPTLVLAALLAGLHLAAASIESASAAGGCRDFKGRLHPEGARVDQSVISGVKTLTMTPVWYVCRSGVWVSAANRKPFGTR
jgi:hypothetical protein